MLLLCVLMLHIAICVSANSILLTTWCPHATYCYIRVGIQARIADDVKENTYTRIAEHAARKQEEVCVCVCVFVCAYVYIYIYVYVYIYTYIYIHIHICIIKEQVYTYTHL
jgi:hypothetical protein